MFCQKLQPECFVDDRYLYGSSHSEQHKSFAGQLQEIPYGSRCEAKNSIADKISTGHRSTNLNFCLRLNYLYFINLHMVVLTVDGTKRFSVHCKHYRMEFDGRQKIQSETKISTGDRDKNLNASSPIELVVIHGVPYNSSYRRRDSKFSGSHYTLSYGTRSKRRNSV